MTRRAAAYWLLVVLLAGCTAAEPEPAAETANPVLAAREALGEPMLELAEAVIALSEGLDEARFKVERGDDMRSAVSALERRRDAVAEAQRAAAEAAADAPVAEAGEIVASAADTARGVLPRVDAELRYLRRLSEIDSALFDAAATWDEPGSQSEIRERLLGVADDVRALRPKVRALKPEPGACKRMPLNRKDWVATVRSRTLELQGQANSAGGTTFDDLRSSYRALPFAVEPRTEDRADRRCWLDRSEVVSAAAAMRSAVDDLRESLSR